MKVLHLSNGFVFKVIFLTLIILVLWTCSTAYADDLTVPSIPFPTLQDAVDEAAGNGDALNTIYLNGVISLSATVHLLGADFGADRMLIFRPVPSQSRATIEMSSSFDIAFVLNLCHNITFRDLDILRTGTNGTDLIFMDLAENIIFERCRMGSVSSPGALGTNVMSVAYPKEIVVRNCIFFSAIPGVYYSCLYANNFQDDENSLFLYNNVFADHYAYGVYVTDLGGGEAGALVLLRNNVVVNTPALEPTAYYSMVGAPVIIVTSHNVAFASAAHVEEIAVGCESISGETLAGGEFLRYDRDFVDDVFVEFSWIVAPPWDPNPDFFRLSDNASNPMHDDISDFGLTVTTNGLPHARDKAVLNDIEQDGRPGGVPLHTDRGADQLEPGICSATVSPHKDVSRLWASPRANPGADPAVLYRTGAPGRLLFEVFDAAGRKIASQRRTVAEGESGLLTWRQRTKSGVLFYRLVLRGEDGRESELAGKIVVLR